MSVHDLGMTNGVHSPFIYMAPDGSQRFDRADVDKAIAGGAVPGTVMTGDELRKWIDDEISRNQENKKTLEDLIKDSCAGWSSAKFKFAGEPKLYSYYEFIEEMERRSEQNDKAVQGVVNGFPEPAAENSLGRLSDESEASAVSEEQIALLFEDRNGKKILHGVPEIPEEQESNSDAEIITKPDGTKILMITTQIGETETVMSVKISEDTTT